MKRALVLAVWLAALPARAESGRDAFFRGANLAQEGKHAEAAEVLAGVAARGPDEPFADDALLELARLREEKLGDPAGAAEAYERLVREFPTSRLAIRATRRAEVLRAGLGPDNAGAAPLAAFQDALAHYAERGPADSIARVEKLLGEHPRWSEAPRARLWLGSVHEREGQLDAALREYRAVVALAPAGEWAMRGWKAQGDVLLWQGDLDGAAQAYARLEALAVTPGDVVAARAAVERLDTARLRRAWERGAWAVLAGFALAMVLTARRGAGSWGRGLRALVRPPVEAIYLLPVAILLAGAAATEHVVLGNAVIIVAGGGVMVAWLNGAALAAGGPVRWERAVLHAILCVAAVAAIGYIAVVREQLIDLFLETLHHGPER